jgi:hypothetical protein
MKKLLGLGPAVFFLLAQPAGQIWAATEIGPSKAAFRVELSPQVGSGRLSSGESVRHTTGYGVSISHDMTWSWLRDVGIKVSPKAELTNSVLSALRSRSDTKSVLTYDNRMISGGVTVSPVTKLPIPGFEFPYASLAAGRGFSKVTIDESASRTFRQSLYSGISGTFWSGEIGSWIPLKPDFGLSLALVGSSYIADQSQASGTFQGEVLAPDDSLSLVSGSQDGSSAGLAKTLTIDTYSAKVGVFFQF